VLSRAEDVGEGTRHLLEQSESMRSAHGLRALVRDVLKPTPTSSARSKPCWRSAPKRSWRPVSRALAAVDRLRSADAGRAVLVVERPDEPLRTGFVPLEPLLSRVRVRAGFEGVRARCWAT
jgi:hypothetical protein